MRDRIGTVGATARTALLGVSFAALAVSAHAAEYKMTVNKDRLINTGSSRNPRSSSASSAARSRH
jgi:hypothetical protein